MVDPHEQALEREMQEQTGGETDRKRDLERHAENL